VKTALSLRLDHLTDPLPFAEREPTEMIDRAGGATRKPTSPTQDNSGSRHDFEIKKIYFVS
jgi:hypothetical protein